MALNIEVTLVVLTVAFGTERLSDSNGIMARTAEKPSLFATKELANRRKLWTR